MTAFRNGSATTPSRTPSAVTVSRCQCAWAVAPTMPWIRDSAPIAAGPSATHREQVLAFVDAVEQDEPLETREATPPGPQLKLC